LPATEPLLSATFGFVPRFASHALGMPSPSVSHPAGRVVMLPLVSEAHSAAFGAVTGAVPVKVSTVSMIRLSIGLRAHGMAPAVAIALA